MNVRMLDEIWAYGISFCFEAYAFCSSMFTYLLGSDSCQKQKYCTLLITAWFLHVIWMCCATLALMIMYDSCWNCSFYFELYKFVTFFRTNLQAYLQILAHVEFNPDGLPDGWVKETIFRKCKDGIRKDPVHQRSASNHLYLVCWEKLLIPFIIHQQPQFDNISNLIMQYYTDPVSHRVFRTLKSVLSYLGTGEISKHSYLPRRNVIDMYSFDKCADLVISFSALYLSLSGCVIILQRP